MWLGWLQFFSKSLGPSEWVGIGLKMSWKNFEPFLYHKNSGASLLKFGPFGAGSHGAGKLTEFLRGSTSVFMI